MVMPVKVDAYKSFKYIELCYFYDALFCGSNWVFVVISIFHQQNGLRDAPIDVAIGRLVVVSQVLSSHFMFSHNLFPNPSLQGCCQPGLSDEASIFCSSQTGWE